MQIELAPIIVIMGRLSPLTPPIICNGNRIVLGALDNNSEVANPKSSIITNVLRNLAVREGE